MGIPGLEEFLNQHSDLYFAPHQLHHSYLVVDGDNLAGQMYMHSECENLYGGDYDIYIRQITDFFKLLKQCAITPLVIFDGGYQAQTLKKLYKKRRSTIGNMGRDAPPLFARDVFCYALSKLDIETYRVDFDADNELVSLSQVLSCPILSFDRDFYTRDVLFIPFSQVQHKVMYDHRSFQGVKYLQCNVFKIGNFLRSFGGLDKNLLPFLGAILGNEYLIHRNLKKFFKTYNLQVCDMNNCQESIQCIFTWLHQETFKSALSKLLEFVKPKQKEILVQEMLDIVRGSTGKAYEILSYFNIERPGTYIEPARLNLYIEDFKITQDFADDQCQDQDDEFVNSQESCSSQSDPYDICQDDFDFNLDEVLPSWVLERCKKCEYPAYFIDIAMRNRYLPFTQVESHDKDSSHFISMSIISALHTILTSGKEEELIFADRIGPVLRNYSLKKHPKDLPKVYEVPLIGFSKKQKLIMELLGFHFSILESLRTFPPSWHLFLLGIMYWIRKTWPPQKYLYSILLSAFVIRFIDVKIGFFRKQENFFMACREKIKSMVRKQAELTDIVCITDCVTVMEEIECLLLMERLIFSFEANEAIGEDIGLVDQDIIHAFAELQSVLYHLSHLNTLLGYPFKKFYISDFYNGVFVYNLANSMMKEDNMCDYFQELFNSAPTCLTFYQIIVDTIISQIFKNFGDD